MPPIFLALLYTLITNKNQNFRVLPLARNSKHSTGSFRQSSSREKVTAASRDLHITSCDPCSIHQPRTPARLTKPERWPLPKGSIYEGVTYCAMPHFHIFLH